MEQISNTLVQILQQVTGFSNRALEMSGLDEQFHAVADTVYAYPIYPVLIMVHFTTVVFKIRASEGIHFASSNPFGSLLSTVILCFAGSIIQNLLLGLPLIKPLEKSFTILMISLVWYLVFFCPLDIFARLLTFLPIKIPIIVLKETYRVKCVLSGIQLAFSLFPDSWLIIITAGSIRGCGSMVLKPFVHQIVGLGPATIEFHRPSFTTKISILVSCVFALQVKGLLDASLASISLIFTVLLTTFQLLFLFSSQNDPFAPLENTLAAIFLRHPKQTVTTDSNERKTKSD